MLCSGKSKTLCFGVTLLIYGFTEHVAVSDSTVKSASHQGLLEDHFRPSAPRINAEPEVTFEEDNDPKNSSKSTKIFFYGH